jgi:hypothetical protein
MATIKKMILLEDALEAIFRYLPPMKYEPSYTKSFKPTFSYGDKKDLNIFLKLKSKEQQHPYPLIWLEYPFLEIHKENKMEAKEVSLILAVQTNSSMQNNQRLKETYRKVLNPLFDNIRHCLKFANIVNISGEYKLRKFPNYSDDNSSGESNKTIAIWDAIKITFDIEIVDNVKCLREIKFPKS